MKRYPVAACLIAGLCVGSAAFAYGIKGHVVAGGGISAPAPGSGTYAHLGTVAQAAVGFSSATAYRGCAGFWCFGGPRVVPVEPARPPLEFTFGAATPNPTRAGVVFRLVLPKAANVTLSVFDVSGRQVGVAVDRALGAGEHELTWRAPGSRAGVYFVQLGTDGQVRARRSVVIVP